MKRRLLWMLIAFVAMGLGIMAWDRITLWQHHLEYLRHCPGVRPPDTCTDVSYGFWWNIWRIPEEARTPLTETQGKGHIYYSFVWIICTSVAGKSEEELLKDFESDLVRNGWSASHEAWTPEQLPRYGIGLEGLFNCKENAGRRARFAWHETKGGVSSTVLLFVACWREEQEFRMKVVGMRADATPVITW